MQIGQNSITNKEKLKFSKGIKNLSAFLKFIRIQKVKKNGAKIRNNFAHLQKYVLHGAKQLFGKIA